MRKVEQLFWLPGGSLGSWSCHTAQGAELGVESPGGNKQQHGEGTEETCSRLLRNDLAKT